MKTLIRFGFVVWSRNHCGMRVLVHSKKCIRNTIKYNIELGIRRVLIALAD